MLAIIVGGALLAVFVIVAVKSAGGQKSSGRDDGSWKKWTGGS